MLGWAWAQTSRRYRTMPRRPFGRVHRTRHISLVFEGSFKQFYAFTVLARKPSLAEIFKLADLRQISAMSAPRSYSEVLLSQDAAMCAVTTRGISEARPRPFTLASIGQLSIFANMSSKVAFIIGVGPKVYTHLLRRRMCKLTGSRSVLLLLPSF